MRATCSSSTRSTASAAPSRRSSIRRWRTSSSTSCWARARPPGRSASTCRRFTLVGATTRTGLITGPLRDRFGLVARLDYYDAEELQAIVVRAAGILGIEVDPAGAREIARRARGTPRIANRLLRRVRDFAEVRGHGAIDEATAHEGLAVFGVDDRGLDKVDRAVLMNLCRMFGGGPVGLGTLAISVGEAEETVEDVYEPFLIQQGLLMRTPRGRVATPAAWAHMGLVAPPSAAPRRRPRPLPVRPLDPDPHPDPGPTLPSRTGWPCPVSPERGFGDPALPARGWVPGQLGPIRAR